jgi:hypothetical protein
MTGISNPERWISPELVPDSLRLDPGRKRRGEAGKIRFTSTMMILTQLNNGLPLPVL